MRIFHAGTSWSFLGNHRRSVSATCERRYFLLRLRRALRTACSRVSCDRNFSGSMLAGTARFFAR